MKKELCFLAAGLLLINTTAAFAGTPDATAESGSAPTTGSAISTVSPIAVKAPIKLSLKDAVKIMQTTGTRAETAALNKKSDEAVALGYGEKIQTINSTQSKLELADKYYPPAQAVELSLKAQEAGVTSNNKKILKLRKEFAKTQVDANYKAEMNQIEYDTINVYYGVLLAQENLKTEQDNLKTQEDILKNTKAQYQVGMLAKKDVLSAQSGVTSAESGVRAAQTKLEYAKMGFNFMLGYAAMQEVIFTDTLDTVAADAVDVEASVKSALANRNEIKGANLAVGIYQILLEDVSNYPRSSSTYLNRLIQLQEAQKTAKDAPVQIEIDIRNKAAELADKKAALDAAKALQAYAQEGYRLVSISYEAGMSTLAELQQVQVNVYKAGLGVSAATSDYDLAVYAFKYAQDVGVERLPL